jgi:DUF1680 family protein
VNLRIPGWLESPARISVNGKSSDVPAAKGTFAQISRRWRDGDTVQLTLRLNFRAQPIDDKHEERVALLYGPQMMVAVNPAVELHDTPLTLPGKPRPISNRASAFALSTPGTPVEMIPFHAIRDEVYTTYLRKA